MGRQFSARASTSASRHNCSARVSNRLPKTTKPKATIVPADGGERREIDMTAKAGQSDWAGWFTGRMLLTKPGDYTLELPIPSSSDLLRGKFTVRESNPELENTRPDPAALAAMAGDLDEIKNRLRGPITPDELQAAVARQVYTVMAKSESPKLLFTLATGDVIPNCLPAVPPQVSRNRGPVDDLWDHGPEFGQLVRRKANHVATLLMVIVGLLSLEWLTRKLLRLA